MNINTYLKNASTKLILSDDEKSHIKTSIDNLINKIDYYFSCVEFFNIKDILIFGSYHRNTILPRIYDDNSDVDIMVVFDDDGTTSQTYLNRIRRAIERYFSSSLIKQSSPTIVLDMTHIKIEVTPAKYSYGLYYIRDNDDWQITYASKDFDNLSLANRNNKYEILPIIRLVKYWNVTHNYKYISSYKIEKAIVNTFLSGSYCNYDFKHKLLVAFKAIEFLDNNVMKAIECLSDAINYEIFDYEISKKKLDIIFGDL